MKILLISVFFLLSPMTSLAADDVVCSGGGSSQCYLIDNNGSKWDAQIAFTTDGSGDIFTLGDVASSDNVIGVSNSSNRTLIDNSGNYWRAAVFYTTDGSGNVIPVPAGGGGGGVTAVTGTAPVVSSGGSTPAISMAAATNSVPGYLTSADHTTFASKLASTDGAYSLSNTSDATKLQKWDLSGETTGDTLTVSPQNTSSMVLHIPQVATASGAGMALVQDETTGFIFSHGITSSIGAANSMMQLADASTANRAQIKLHSYFNGASVAGVSTLTSRSGTIGTNSAVVNGQDYSKWTAQAAATTPGSAPISGAWAFKANTVNSLTVTSDFHLQLTNLAGTLGDRLYLGSEGALQLPHYGAGLAHFDSSGNMTSSAIAASEVPLPINRVYVDYSDGNDSTGNGSSQSPWKTIQHACNSISPTVNVPITIWLSGGNNDTDTGTITCAPNIALFSEYSIEVAVPFTVTGGSTNDQFWAQNIIFLGAFTWSRNDATDMTFTAFQSAFGGATAIKQSGAGGLAIQAYNSSFDAATEIQAPTFGSLFFDCLFQGSMTFDDVTSSAYYEFLGGYMGAPVSISGGPTAYFSGIQADVPFGYTLTAVTTGNGSPTFQSDASSIPPVITGTPVLVPTTYTPQGTAAQQPTCSASIRGLQWLTDSIGGVADTFQICQQTISGFSWVTH